jgi:hypothetical protein
VHDRVGLAIVLPFRGSNLDATADILAELRVLEREEEEDSYSLLVVKKVRGQGSGGQFTPTHTSPIMGMSGRSSLSPSTGGSSKLLGPVFVDDEFVARKCCGYIGLSAYFCLRDKVSETGFASCTTRAHAERKFEPLVDSFYAPIGLSISATSLEHSS